MATWGWLTATLLFGLVAGYVGCKVVTLKIRQANNGRKTYL